MPTTDTDNFEEPDFSGDDFANDKELQKIRREEKEYAKMIDESISSVVSGLRLKKGSHLNLKGFTMFKNLQATLTESYESSILPSSLFVSIASYYSSTSVGRVRSSGHDPYLFGRLKMKTKYPPTYVCRETVREMLHDLVLNQETDFPEHKKFSRKFYVLTSERERLKDLLRLKTLDDLTIFRDMELELQGAFCLFRHSRRPVSPKEASSFVELAKTLSNVFG